MKTFRLVIFGALALAVLGGFSARRAAGAATAPQTSSAKKKSKKKHSSKRDLGQKAPTPDRISEIQSALAKGGYYQGDPNGKWDGDTVAALQKFQSSHGIDASGKLDAATLQKLGLGSDVAGVSAPRTPQPTPPSGTTLPPASSSPSSPSPSGTLSSSASSPNSASVVTANAAGTGSGSALK